MKEKIKNILGHIRGKFNNVKLGKNVYIGKTTKIINGRNIILENDIQIRPDCFLSCNDNSYITLKEGCDIGTRSRIIAGNKILIEKEVITGPNVFISDQDHKYDNIKIPIKRQGTIVKKGKGIRIGEGSWLGINSVIIGNVDIGKGCVIGANAVVTRNIPDYSVAVGMPAKVIKKYNLKTQRWEKIK